MQLMQRDRESFIIDIMRKSPVIGTCMMLGLMAGISYGIFCTVRGFEDGIGIRLLLMVVAAFALGGGFLGLIIGVFIDTILGIFRGEEDKKKKSRRKHP
jgi:hypothetical protein